MAKWLPSHRTHNIKNDIAKDIIKKLEITEKEYRTTLTKIRKKLKLIEITLTNRDYENINFEKVPTKAMLKYRQSFNTRFWFSVYTINNEKNKRIECIF